MKDCNIEIRKFHNNSVRLSGEMREELLSRAKANEQRLKNGLKANEEPAPVWFVLQGSYAMKTTVQHPKNDYDIDDGAVFWREDLIGSKGAEKSPLAARQMVCDALKADPLKNFSRDPEVRTNCVRIYYKSGYHVDVPVYRVDDPDSDSKIYELASVSWKRSSPEGVTDWFKQQIKEKRNWQEPENTSQLRRMIRLLKKFSVSRESWNMPSGFILTVLATERFAFNERDDLAFYNLLCQIRERLNAWNGLSVAHPVLLGEYITKTSEDASMKIMQEKLQWAIDELAILFDAECTMKKALKTWKSVFEDPYFDELIEEHSSVKSFSILSSEPQNPVQKDGGGRFG